MTTGGLLIFVRGKRLELSHLAAYAPETYASTNSAIPAAVCFKRAQM